MTEPMKRWVVTCGAVAALITAPTEERAIEQLVLTRFDRKRYRGIAGYEVHARLASAADCRAFDSLGVGKPPPKET